MRGSITRCPPALPKPPRLRGWSTVVPPGSHETGSFGSTDNLELKKEKDSMYAIVCKKTQKIVTMHLDFASALADYRCECEQGPFEVEMLDIPDSDVTISMKNAVPMDPEKAIIDDDVNNMKYMVAMGLD